MYMAEQLGDCALQHVASFRIALAKLFVVSNWPKQCQIGHNIRIQLRQIGHNIRILILSMLPHGAPHQ